MQTHHHSRLEVGADFGVSLLVNLVGQLLCYGALATASRSVLFAAVLLGLAIPRRYVTRRVFNAFVAPGARQLRWQSWCEVIVDTVVAIVMAILLQRLFYGAAATWAKAGGLTLALYAFTMVRRYTMRRLFEAWDMRQEQVALYPSAGLS